MKFINYLLLLSFFFCYGCKRKETENQFKNYPPYKLIRSFSQKIHPETGLILRSYGINSHFPKDYEHENKPGIGNFKARYSLPQNKNDSISLEYARNVIIALGENFLRHINSCEEIKNDLDVYPFIANLICLSIYFEDEIRVELGQGIAHVTLMDGKIKYQGYNIEEYRNTYPARGKHYIIHEESYADALEIVKKQGSLKYLE